MVSSKFFATFSSVSIVHDANMFSEIITSLLPSISNLLNLEQPTNTSGILDMLLFDALSSDKFTHLARLAGISVRQLFERSALTKAVARPISSGRVSI
uniref:Uncharacterized protein n=1 Tax=Arundo donax TaxID=35708 RepID=A0A0A9CHC8_ARUDO